MSEPRAPFRRDSPVLPTPTRLLYLAGASPERDAATLQQLSALTGQVQLTTVATMADVQQRIGAGGYHAVVISHALPQSDTLTLIGSLRKANAPIAIVPVVTESQRDLYASAVAVGADDVLILLGGTLLHPTETLVRVRQSRYLPAHEVEAVRAAMRARPAKAAGAPAPPSAPSRADESHLPQADRPAEAAPRAAAGRPADSHHAPPAPQPSAAPPRAVDLTPPTPTPPRVAPRSEHDDLRRQLREATDALAAERSAAQTARRQLEARLREAESQAASSGEVQTSLAASKLDLEQAAETHTAARQAWERERGLLLADVQGAGAAKAALEARLETMAAEADRHRVLHGEAEAAWARRQHELEAAAASAREALAAEARRRDIERQTAEEASRAEGATWDEARRGLEDRLRAAEAEAEGERRRAGDLGSTEATLRQAIEAHAAERQAWVSARETLERRAASADAALDARWQAEGALEESRSAFDEANRAHQQARAAWDRQRADLEARLHETRNETIRRSEDAIRQLETDLRTSSDALMAERAVARTARQQLESRQDDLDRLTREREEQERAQDVARAELRQLGEARAADERAARQARDRAETLQAELETARAAQADLDAAARAAQAEIQALTDAVAATRAAAEKAAEAFETRLGEAASTARHDRAEFETTIAALGADVRRAVEVSASDRIAHDVAVEQLRAQRAELAAVTNARDEAVSTLDRARAELAAALDRAAVARRDADTARDALTAARAEVAVLSEVRDRADRTLAEVRAELADVRDAEAQARDAARQEADAYRQQITALAGARRDLEQAIGAAEAARQRTADERDRERAGWTEARQTLANRQQEAERAAAAAEASNAALASANDALRADLQRTEAAHGTAAEAWRRDRQALEDQRASAAQAQAAERMDWMTARVALETRISQSEDELDRLGEEAEALRTELSRVAARHDRLARSDLFGYAVTTLDGWLVHCNDAFAALLGYANARDALASASEHAFGSADGDVIDAASLSEGHVRYRDALLTRVDGQSVRVLQSAVLVPGTPGQDHLVERIVVDLSDRTMLEDRLRTAQRLEAVGRLTAAMAPELEALVALIDAGLPAPSDPLDDGSDLASPPSAAAVAEIRQLLAFTRKQARPATLVDLNEAVERVSPMLARLVSSHVDFGVRLGASSLIAADEEDFEQMITALVVAARDLLSVGGSVMVETGTIDGDDADRRPSIGIRSQSGPVLTVTAAGYGVQLPEVSSTLEAVVERSSATLQVTGVTGRRASFRVHLTRVR